MKDRPDDLEFERELASLLLYPPCSLNDALDKLKDDESYFLCDAGGIMRALRGPAISGPTLSTSYAAIVEFYNLEGNLLDKRRKGFEPTSAFLMHYTNEVLTANFYLLQGKPSFIPSKNGTYRDEVGVLLIPNRKMSFDHIPTI